MVEIVGFGFNFFNGFLVKGFGLFMGGGGGNDFWVY